MTSAANRQGNVGEFYIVWRVVTLQTDSVIALSIGNCVYSLKKIAHQSCVY